MYFPKYKLFIKMTSEGGPINSVMNARNRQAILECICTKSGLEALFEDAETNFGECNKYITSRDVSNLNFFNGNSKHISFDQSYNGNGITLFFHQSEEDYLHEEEWNPEEMFDVAVSLIQELKNKIHCVNFKPQIILEL